MPTFAHPSLLWLLLPLGAALVWRWLSAPAAIAVSSTTHFRPTPPPRLLAPRHLLLALEVIAAAAFIIALARPQYDIEVMPVSREGTDIMLVLDYSNSMDAFDPDPGVSKSAVSAAIADGTLLDRLGVAREQIARFVKRRPGDRIGLVIFGIDSYVACPPTLDHDFLVAQVGQLTNSLLGGHERGTNIAGGIAAAINTLIDHGENRRTIVLITDGDNTIRDKVFTTTGAAEAAAAKDITIHTVGIGSDNPHLRRGGGNANNVRFDTRTLEKIASTAGGRFFRAKNNQGFEDVMDTIDALETSSRIHPALIFQRDVYPPVLLFGAAALLVAYLLRQTLLLEIA